VLDLTRVVSGPFCSMQLGDLGAEIIKIEEPTRGDDSRAFGPPFVGSESAYFLSVNRNKQSCAINLKSPAGRDLIRELASRSDVLIENFRPGTMDRLGLGLTALREDNPRLICCSISGFGTSGPDAQRPGYDLIVQGESGIMDITGEAGGPPTKVGTSIGDLVAGLYATQAILAALAGRERTGEGCSVNVAMIDSLASLLIFNAGIYFTTKQSPTRRGNTHPTIAPYETFRASDGWINLGIANDKFWQLFCDCVGAEDLAADNRFLRAPNRVKHRAELIPKVAKIIAAKPRDQWVTLLTAAGIPCGQIRTVGEVCQAEQIVSRGMIIQMEHPSAGVISNIGSPIHFEESGPVKHVPPPLHGQHTREILKDFLAMHDSEIDALLAQGVIRASHDTSLASAHHNRDYFDE